MTVSRKLLVSNNAGFHLRVASMLSQAVKNFPGNVFIVKDTYRADAKSCIDLLAVMAPCGTELVVEVDGESQEALLMAEHITNLFEHKFWEDEFAGKEPG